MSVQKPDFVSDNFDLQGYLDRIGYRGELQISLKVLAELQSLHLKAIPFENLDIYYHVPIDFKNAFDKIILRNRGGFCYELNYLFYQLLKRIGFDVKLISCRVFDKEKEKYGEEFDHMAIITRINGDEYLTDAGFGEFALHPVKIELEKETTDPRGVFIIKKSDDGYFIVEKRDIKGDYIPEYKFTTMERQPDDFVDMCIYHQTSSESHFTQKRVCSIPTDEGRITITGNLFKSSTFEATVEEQIETEQQFEDLLWKHFNIKFPL